MFKIKNASAGYTNKRRMLFEVVRKVLGRDTPNYPQKIGDDVGVACKNLVEYLEAVQVLLGEQKEFKSIYAPYIYYASRTKDGKLRSEFKHDQDGSILSYGIEAIKQGVLSSDGQEPYSGELSRKWGNGDLDNVPTPDLHIVKNYEAIDNVDDIARSIYHGYPVIIGSSIAFEMLPNKDGFHYVNPYDRWNHVYTIIGFESHPKYGLYFILLNTWGDCHGTLKDFKTEENLPEGVLRVTWETMVEVISKGSKEVYAISPYDDFPARASEIDKAMKN